MFLLPMMLPPVAMQGGSGTLTSTQMEVPDWRPIASAPRDGTIIEVRCTYGVAPWYGLYHWTEKITVQGTVCDWQGTCKPAQKTTVHSPGWHKVGDDASGIAEDNSFMWRPYKGTAQGYVDPTGGAQDTDQYWRHAAGVP